MDAIETTRLRELEEVIERGLKTFAEVGAALLEIRDQRLYRASHGTFEAYLKERWDISRSYAHRTIEAARIVEMLPNGNKPKTEAVARALAPLKDDPEKVVVAWEQATDGNAEPTAREVQDIVVEIVAGGRESDHDVIVEGAWPDGSPRYVDAEPTRPPLKLLQAHEADNRWYALQEGIRALDRFIGLADEYAASVPANRRASTAKRLRKAGTAFGAIALRLER